MSTEYELKPGNYKGFQLWLNQYFTDERVPSSEGGWDWEGRGDCIISCKECGCALFYERSLEHLNTHRRWHDKQS